MTRDEIRQYFWWMTDEELRRHEGELRIRIYSIVGDFLPTTLEEDIADRENQRKREERLHPENCWS